MLDIDRFADILAHARIADFFVVKTMQDMQQLDAKPYDICCCEETLCSYTYSDNKWILMTSSVGSILCSSSEKYPFTQAPKIRNW